MANRPGVYASAAHEFFSLEAVDFGQLKEEVSANPIEEDHLIMEAVQLAGQRKFDSARDVAESVLLANPNNATALQVNASECESRQDWGEAARFFLAGMGHNRMDGAMEHGFQTNVDLLRASRPRCTRHTHTHAQKKTCKIIIIHTYTQMYTHKHSHAHTLTYTHEHTRIRTHSHAHTHPHAHTHASKRTRINV